MKKAWQFALAGLCAVFLAFTAGLFLGRSQRPGAVSVELAVPRTAPSTSVPPQTSPETTAVVFPIDLNTADTGQLQAIAGIGPVLAQRIVAFREENGPFTQIEQLLLVEGIGEKRLENMLEFITIGA